jgi:uncharacterized phage protein gp47/JayE
LYEFAWEGPITPEIGDVFFHDRLYFTLRSNPDKWPTPFLEANEPGTASNNIEPGTAAIPMRTNNRLFTATFVQLIEPGADTESDDNYRRRIMEKIAGPAENGNRQHYKTWAESIAGVGRARIIPLFAGPNSVMAVLIDTEGNAATQTVIDRVQEYIDPITDGLMTDIDGEGTPVKRPAKDSEGNIVTVGSGLGDGQANIGAHFAAVAPSLVTIDITFDAELAAGADAALIVEEVKIEIDRYFRDINLNNPERTPMVVRVSVLSAILHNHDGLIDYANLTLNGGSGNVALTDRQIAVLGEVEISAII